ncbi:hypothetical protein [Bacillus sp. CECT 9360]|uniref:hypothetical protein n=1 Tax=Bacillus sp. CECT 9360 TaxID=2845821 RepID=UPI001E55F745|nr:hypothetical protein [Bacillus sp. CECT 9360]CAH0344046.1 hypothetical protein BCI9360_00277 [Bacillus sp. CECT 9360]
MKKISLFFVLFTFMISSSVQALSWAYLFVVWEGKVYEVKQEEIVANSEIGKSIGEVRTIPDDMTGDYYGNASNYYPKGTKYYEIMGTSTSSAIAVKEDNQWVKAVFVHKAPFHIMNIFSNVFSLVVIGVILFIVIGAIIRTKKSKNL